MPQSAVGRGPVRTATAIIAGVILGVSVGLVAVGVSGASEQATIEIWVLARDYRAAAELVASEVSLPSGTSTRVDLVLPVDTTLDELRGTVAFRAECIWLAGVLSGTVSAIDAIDGLEELVTFDRSGFGIGSRLAGLTDGEYGALRRHVDINCGRELTDQVGYVR